MRTTLTAVTLALFLSFGMQAQVMNNYWVHNFNSTSSLLGGAVVAGEGDNASIYYNPATIGQMQKGSNVSLAANLFTWNFYFNKNALGDGIPLNTNNFQVQPQFVSYTYTPPKEKGISIAVAVLTRNRERIHTSYANTMNYNVIDRYPGDERYSSSFIYENSYIDTWIGLAMSHQVNERLSYGITMFVSFSSLNYNYSWYTSAFNAYDTLGSVNYGLSQSSYDEYLRFTDYRLIFKAGIAYKFDRWKFGFCLTTPNVNVFSSGKKNIRLIQQFNIEADGEPLPDFDLFDGQEGGELKTNYKLPWSFALGVIYDMPLKGRKLYFTAQYFTRISYYNMVEAQPTTLVNTDEPTGELIEIPWLSYGYAARPLLNVALGYSWTIRKDLIFLNAFRTDFSSVYGIDIEEEGDLNYIKTTEFNIYHYSAGVKFTIGRQRFLAGGDFGFGYKGGQREIANFNDPVEYDMESGRALQGPLLNDMSTYYIGFSIYLGATLNFIRQNEPQKKE